MPTIFISTGMQLIGQIIATLYSGVVLTQAYDYFSLYTKDSAGLRFFVGSLVLMITFAVAGQTASLYEALVVQAGVASPKFPIIHYVPLYTNAIAISLSQGFMVWRTFRVTKSHYVAAGLLALVSLDCATWMVVNVNSQKTNAAPDLAAKLKDVKVLNQWVIINSGLSAATDVLISEVLSWKLLQTKRAAGGYNEATDSILSRLLQITVGTAGITSFITIFVLIAVKVQPLGCSYHLLLGASTATSSVSCVLYCLNSRQKLRLIQEGQTGSHSNDIIGGGTRGTKKYGANPVSGISIRLDTFVHTEELDSRSGETRKEGLPVV